MIGGDRWEKRKQEKVNKERVNEKKKIYMNNARKVLKKVVGTDR